jgi:predicted DNA-binding transcriptional regulator YafY
LTFDIVNFLILELVCYDDLSNYKIECISDLQILDEDIKNLKDLPGQENFKLDDYINEHIYMTYGNSVKAKLKLNNEKVIGDIIDLYGENIEVYQEDASILVELKVNEQALLYWAMQYGEIVEIIDPKETRQKYKEMLDKISSKY